jgi:hypothetical protein
MNDVREAIERIGEQFNPPDQGLEDLSRRRNRARARRRIAAGAFALAVAAGGSLLAVRAFLAPTPGSHPNTNVATTPPFSSPATSTASASGPDCPAPSGDSRPQVVLSSTSGPAGSSVEVSGRFDTGQRWLQLWWNAVDEMPERLAPPPWPPTGPDLPLTPAGPGPVVKLASVAGPATVDGCSFHTEFTVPDVDPGTYQVLWVSGVVNSSPGYWLFDSPVTFEVTG